MTESEKLKWQTTDSRFVIFLDIMGFKDFVSRNTHEQVYNMMVTLSASKELLESTFKDEKLDEKYKASSLYTTSFSDSIILFSHDSSLVSFEIIMTSAAFIIAESLMKAIPMKGAFAYGEISVNKSQQIYFGQPIIDAYLLQEEVNYYGIVFHHSVDKFIQNKKSEIEKETKDFFFESKTPLKAGSVVHRNINWLRFLDDGFIDLSKTKKQFHAILNDIRSITSGLPRKYIDNTNDIFKNFFIKNIESTRKA